MRTIYLTIVLTLIGFHFALSQESKPKKDQPKGPAEYSQAIQELTIQVNKQQAKIESLEKNEEIKSKAQEEKFNAKIDQLETRINYYLIFGGLLIGLIGFLINFLGRQLIKERVEKLIQRTAFNYAQKTTHQVINSYIAEGKVEEAIEQNGQPAIEKIIKKLESEGFLAIDSIKTKGEEAISSMLAKHAKSTTDSSDTNTDEGIAKANKKSRADEFFNLALSSKDALVQISLYQMVLELEPNSIEALNNLGVSYNDAHNPRKAIEALEKCVKLGPKYSLAYANMAQSYNLLNEVDKALEIANKALDLNYKVDFTYSVKGSILTKKGDFAGAEETFAKGIALNPKSPELYFNRGFFYEVIKQYEKSEVDYFKAEKLGFSNKAMLYNNFAVLYRRKKEFEKAIDYLNKARKENPDFPNIDGTLALIYADKKDTDNFYKYLVIALGKGCPAWNYLSDPGFDDYRNEEKLTKLLETYKKKYTA